MLVKMGIVEEASLKFFERWHTKNDCDRAFGTAKKKTETSESYNMEELVSAVDTSSTTTETINLEEEDRPFRDWKACLFPFFRKVTGLQSYQLFRASKKKSG